MADDMVQKVNALLARIGERLAKTHPDLDEAFREDVVELLCNEVFLKQAIDPGSVPPEDWRDLVDGAVEEIQAFGAVDLRPVSANQMACEGFDLVYLLNTDDAVGPELYRKLNLTYTLGDIDGLAMYSFDEIDEEGVYLITWPEDEEEFLMQTVCAIEPFSREAFEALGDEEVGGMCDGECGGCGQDCPGKE